MNIPFPTLRFPDEGSVSRCRESECFLKIIDHEHGCHSIDYLFVNIIIIMYGIAVKHHIIPMLAVDIAH